MFTLRIAGIVAVALSCFTISANAVNLYSTGFEDPPFVAGSDTWAGTQGWLSTDTTSGVQGILGPGDQAAFLGFNVPAADGTFVWRTFNYDAVGQGNPLVQFSMLLAVIDSTNGEYDYFDILINNSNGDFLGGLSLDNGDLSIDRYDGVTRRRLGFRRPQLLLEPGHHGHAGRQLSRR
jgi:hypothetical protein